MTILGNRIKKHGFLSWFWFYDFTLKKKDKNIAANLIEYCYYSMGNYGIRGHGVVSGETQGHFHFWSQSEGDNALGSVHLSICLHSLHF